MQEIVLASTSPYRRELLERLRVNFRVVAPAVDEEEAKAEGLAPRALAERLAEAKAREVAGRCEGALVIGSDQVCALGDRVLGKPGTAEAARRQLLDLAGREHALITALVVVSGGAVHRHTDVTRLRMRALSAAAIERYVAADRPLDCCGAYRLEAQGVALFERIESEDQSAIIGLPLLALTKMLVAAGWEIP